MKKFSAFLLSLIICLSAITVPIDSAFAATTTYTCGNYSYVIISSVKKTARITRYSGKEENVNIPDKMDDAYTVLEIGSSCFINNTTVKSINIPACVKKIDVMAFSCSELREFTVDADNEYFTSVDGVIYSADMKTLYRCPTAYQQETFVVPDFVKTIGAYAFYQSGTGNDKGSILLHIDIPEGVEKIEDSAFCCSSFKEIVLPESIISVGNSAFLSAAITYLYLGANVETLGKRLFCNTAGTNDSPLKTIEVSEENMIFSSVDNVLLGNYGHDLIYYPRKKINRTYTVPDSVKTLKECSFSFLSLDCIDLNNVEKLEDNALFNVNISKYILSEELQHFYSVESKQSYEIYVLNPKCTIALSTISSYSYSIKIYGYTGSEAENFVNDNSNDRIKLYFTPINAADSSVYHLNKSVYFGEYPQHRVISNVLSEKLSSLDLQWKSYDYYYGNGKLGSRVQSDYMKYADVEYNGKRYRGVQFSQYRPVRAYLNPTELYSYQDDNGYQKDKIYWFKYEPVEWNILDKKDGLVISKYVIDARSFCDEALSDNNYSSSSIRFWLNNDFYNTVFSDEEKKLVNTIKLNPDTSDELFDKVSVPTYDDVLNIKYGFTTSVDASNTRYAVGSDYAQCQGLMVKTSTYAGSVYENNANWLLSTSGESYDTICNVTTEGKVAKNHNSSAIDGVRPVIRLSSVSGVEEETECTHNQTKLIGYKAPSCTSVGNTGSTVCVNCGQVINEGAQIPAKQHSYSVKESSEPTCTQYGRITYMCADCGNAYDEQLDMTAHSVVIDKKIEATCTESGLTQGTHCSVCNQTLNAQQVIPAYGHTIVTDNEIAPDYHNNGLTRGEHCSVCNTVISAQRVVPALVCNHKAISRTVVKKADINENGSTKTICNDCGDELSHDTVKRINDINLSKASLTYNGRVLEKPSVNVMDIDGKAIDAGCYSCTFISRSTGTAVNELKDIGQYKVQLAFNGEYSGTKDLYFTVKPRKSTIKAPKSSSKAITASWKRDKSVTGYQVVIATDARFTKNKKTVKIRKNSITSYKFKKLKKGKKYYIKVCPYKSIKVDGKNATVYGAYSKVKKIICK